MHVTRVAAPRLSIPRLLQFSRTRSARMRLRQVYETGTPASPAMGCKSLNSLADSTTPRRENGPPKKRRQEQRFVNQTSRSSGVSRGLLGLDCVPDHRRDIGPPGCFTARMPASYGVGCAPGAPGIATA